MFSSYDNNNINPENDNDCIDGFDDSRGVPMPVCIHVMFQIEVSYV